MEMSCFPYNNERESSVNYNFIVSAAAYRTACSTSCATSLSSPYIPTLVHIGFLMIQTHLSLCDVVRYVMYCNTTCNNTTGKTFERTHSQDM